MSDGTQIGTEDFEDAFQKMRSAALLCMGLMETAVTNEGTNPDTLMAAVDAICEHASRDIKAIWKRRYTVVANGQRFKGVLQPKGPATQSRQRQRAKTTNGAEVK